MVVIFNPFLIISIKKNSQVVAKWVSENKNSDEIKRSLFKEGQLIDINIYYGEQQREIDKDII